MAIRKLGSRAILAITSAETVPSVIRRVLVVGTCDDSNEPREIYTEAVPSGRKNEKINHSNNLSSNNAIHGALMYTNSILTEYCKIIDSHPLIIVESIHIIMEQLKRLLTIRINSKNQTKLCPLVCDEVFTLLITITAIFNEDNDNSNHCSKLRSPSYKEVVNELVESLIGIASDWISYVDVCDKASLSSLSWIPGMKSCHQTMIRLKISLCKLKIFSSSATFLPSTTNIISYASIYCDAMMTPFSNVRATAIREVSKGCLTYLYDLNDQEEISAFLQLFKTTCTGVATEIHFTCLYLLLRFAIQLIQFVLNIKNDVATEEFHVLISALELNLKVLNGMGLYREDVRDASLECQSVIWCFKTSAHISRKRLVQNEKQYPARLLVMIMSNTHPHLPTSTRISAVNAMRVSGILSHFQMQEDSKEGMMTKLTIDAWFAAFKLLQDDDREVRKEIAEVISDSLRFKDSRDLEARSVYKDNVGVGFDNTSIRTSMNSLIMEECFSAISSSFRHIEYFRATVLKSLLSFVSGFRCEHVNLISCTYKKREEKEMLERLIDVSFNESKHDGNDHTFRLFDREVDNQYEETFLCAQLYCREIMAHINEYDEVKYSLLFKTLEKYLVANIPQINNADRLKIIFAEAAILDLFQSLYVVMLLMLCILSSAPYRRLRRTLDGSIIEALKAVSVSPFNVAPICELTQLLITLHDAQDIDHSRNLFFLLSPP